MRKIFILSILLVSFIVFSCDDTVTFDIQVKNDCDWPIKANISSSQSNSTWYTIPAGGSYSFTGFENGSYFIHATSSENFADARSNNNYLQIKIFTDDTWTISWDYSRSAYAVHYRIK